MELQPVKRNKPMIDVQAIKLNKFAKISILSILIFLFLYLGISIYFSSHFYFGSAINDINTFGKTVEQLNKELTIKWDAYTLLLEERNGVTEQIKAADINLKFDSKGKIQDLKDSQNSFTWIFDVFSKKGSELSGLVTYDEKLLKERLNKLSALDIKKIVEPENASFKYSDTGYVIVNEVMGNKINSQALYTNVVNAISNGEAIINLDKEDCYINPKYITSSTEIIKTKNLLDKYIASKITYTFNGGKEVLDASIIHNWLAVNENLEILFDENKIKNYLSKVDDHYDTYGKKRNFVTSLGTRIKVSGGNYGWLVDRKGEVADLIATIKDGQTVAKEPRYVQTAVSRKANDIGNTYVEINITKQHLWFYKNGSLIVEGDVVTGNVKDHATPKGVYRLEYKEKNATLDGEDYSVPVNVFMPFNGGIGIHDASWRKAFGGSIYLTNGSHGCINTPPIVAQKIFDNIKAMTPIICY